MDFEVTESDVRFPAAVADVRPVRFVVGAQVKFETARIREGFPTLLTAVRLLPGVNGLVQFQAESRRKCFVTAVAGEGLLYQVNPRVHFEITVLCEFLPTLVTGVRHLRQLSLSVCLRVSLKIISSGKSHSTLLTAVGFFACVGKLVCFQITSC